ALGGARLRREARRNRHHSLRRDGHRTDPPPPDPPREPDAFRGVVTVSMVSEPSKILRRLLIRLDLLGLAVALLAAHFLRASVLRPWFTDSLQPLWTFFVWLAPVAALLWFFLMSFFRGYEAPQRNTYQSAAIASLRTVTVGTVALITFGFFFKLHFVSRVFLLMFGVLSFLFLQGNRVGIIWYVRRAQRRGVYRRHVLIVGTGARARRALEILRVGSDWGIAVIGLLDRD